MSTPPHKLRLEMLRMRAEIERAELADALSDLQSRTATLRRLAGAATHVLAAADGSASGPPHWIGLAASLLGHRPWVGLLAGAALRLGRHRPLALLTALAAVVAVARLRSRTPAGNNRAG